MSVAPPIDAASLVLCTRDGRVLLGTRAEAIVFLGGYVAFAGGRQDAEDSAHARRLFGSADPQDILRAAALRELHEEMGLVIRDRAAIRAGQGRFEDVGVPIAAQRLVFVGRWITPEYSPIRYDTRFFLLVVDDAEDPQPADGEMVNAGWFSPAEALAQHAAQQALFPPPTLAILRALRPGLDGAAHRMLAHPSAQGEEHLDFEPLPDIRALPLRTPTLPPATTTNTYVIGRQSLIVVDPATYEADERDKLLCLLEELSDGGAKLEAVVLTHHHPDHVGAAEWVSEKTGAPIWAHPITKDLLDGRVRVDATLVEGDVIDLGLDRAGVPFHLRVLFTPGHAPGHIVLQDIRPNGRSMIVGDMVAAIGTILVDPPQGNMAEYLRQLRRLRTFDEQVLFPAHGPPIVRGHAKLDQYITHRLAREAKVLQALRQLEVGRPEELLEVAYADTPTALYPLAARSCLAHLEKLAEDGLADRQGDRFRVRPLVNEP